MNPRAAVSDRPGTDWDPALYMKFEGQRMLAARDLLARVPLSSAGIVYDLGCGPGTTTELLARRFPGARLTGLDMSEAMLDCARERTAHARFLRQDIAGFTPDATPDLIFANSALHFVPDHDELFPRLAAMLAPGGTLAVQMPSNARESSHALVRMVAAEGPWSARLVPIAKTQPMIAEFEDYYEWLRPLAPRIEMWMTTYVHVVDGPDAIADWFAGSTLRPFLDLLSDDERCDFIGRYRDGLRDAYPPQPDGKVLFAYPRLFIVASKA